MIMKTVTMGTVLLAAVAGCASGREAIVYEKPGLTAAELDRDKALCAGEASARESRPKLFGSVTPDRDEYENCMRRLGYTTERLVLPR